MTKAAEQLLAQALRLDLADRAELLDRLAASWEPSDDPAYAAAWEAELRERIASIERGEEKPIPWRDAMPQIRRGELLTSLKPAQGRVEPQMDTDEHRSG